MLQAITKYKKPLLILGILLVVFIIYSYWRGGNATDPNAVVVSTSNTPAGGESAVGQQFFNQLLTLKKINLNDQVFADPRFQSLEDFSQPLPDEPQGRPNPFAPIGQDSGGNFSSGTTTTPAAQR